MGILTRQKKKDKIKNRIQIIQPIFLIFAMEIFLPIAILAQQKEPSKYYHKIKAEKPYEMFVSKQHAILRSNPTTYAFEIAILNRGEKVKVIYQPEEKTAIGNSLQHWYYVKTEKGYEGWIYGTFLSKTNPTEEELPLEQISLETLSKELVGVWWEVDEFDNTGFRKFEFNIDNQDISKGTFLYTFKDSTKIEGDFEIKNNGKVILNKTLPIGNTIHFMKNPEGYRIILENKNRKYYFKKSTIMDSKNQSLQEESIKNKTEYDRQTN